MEPIITLENASRRYGLDPRPALDGVTLELRRGETTAVVGPSGGGKSTLLNLIAGLDRPTDGRVTVDGVRVDRLSPTEAARFRRRSVGFIFQFFLLLDDLSVLDNVALPAILAGGRRSEANRRASDLLEVLGITHLADRSPGTLSGGERQRVAIGRAVVNEPAVLLADEPTGALDSRNGEVVAHLLLDLHRAGQTVVLATHDRALADRIANREVVLVDGRVSADRSLAAS
jgi:putative ABC transport system ATP-binding protein